MRCFFCTRSKHALSQAGKLGPSCLLVGSQSEHNVLLLTSPKGSVSDIISLIIGFINDMYVYSLVIMNWGSNEVSHTQIKSLLSTEKSLIDAQGQLLSYWTFVNESDPCSNVHYFSSSENKAWTTFRPVYGIWTHDLCNIGAALYQLS